MVKVPNTPDVKTKKYYEFRGVDFTHDHANVFYRRSPNAVNMRPDESGRPIKRHGWDIAISNKSLLDRYNEYAALHSLEIATDIKIYICKYFTLAGQDHIVIFTNRAVFIFENTLEVKSTDIDCILAYERTYFFEANGVSAFYIYGGYKVWRYSYDNGFKFECNTDGGFDIYVPTVLYAQEPTGGGTQLEDFNMLGSICAEQYLHNIYSANVYKVKLANAVSLNDYTKVKVNVTVNTQFDTALTVVNEGTPEATECKLTTSQNAQGEYESFIEFVGSYGTAASTEDTIRVVHPMFKVEITNNTISDTGTATLLDKR